TATAETVTSYTSDVLAYIAEDQNIDADEITPDISAIADSASTSEDTTVEINVLLNDSYLTSSPISVTAGNGTNGTTSIASNIVTYTPNSNFNGTDTFSYTITQGDKTSSADVTVTIEAVNDAPSIDIVSTIQVKENVTAVTTISVSDVDEDELTLTLGGTDADSFNLSTEYVLTFIEAPDYETKTSYSITLTLTDGTETVTKNIIIAITKVNDSFSGEVIDGYISGAEIFIDQNFNFQKDDGEFSAETSEDGSFVLSVDNEDLFQCLSNRPILANVPVGAIDSTLGEVTKAYKMILPSISDTGNTSIVISPFTSLFAESILKSKSDISEDLSVTAGCQQSGDNIASKISSRLEELKTSITNNFGISYDQLISDFIENPSTNVDETSAQNIAALLPYLQIIDTQVSDYLTDTFEKDIRANVTLAEESLSIIFNNTSYDKLPLNFYSIYETRPNQEGWFRSETLDARGANISKEGILSREDCNEQDTALCNVTDLSLANIANVSTSYTKTSSFSKSTPVNFEELGITNGSLTVSSSIASSWRNNSENWDQPNSRSRECQKTEAIYFTTGNEDADPYWSHFSYNNYSQGFEKADCSKVRHYYTPILNASTFLSNDSGSALGAKYYIFDVLRSGISSNLPYDFVDNSVNINPELVVKDVAVLPRMFKDLDQIRALFRGDDYVLFGYDKNSSLSAYFEAGTNPSNDMFWDRESEESTRIYGQAARDAFFNRLKEDTNLNEDFYGPSSPTNNSILGRIANSYIEITDYSNSDEITLQITPTYDYQNQTLDYSLHSSLDLENIRDFIKNGINGNPLNAKIWYNPDGSIQSVVPIKLYLYEGDDSIIDAGENYFEMSFNLSVSSSSSGNTNNYEATQIWTIKEGEEILVSYNEGDTTISQIITNTDEDKITLSDSDTGNTADNLDNYIKQPSNLNIKLLNLISKVSDNISGIQNFFVDGGEYTIELDLGSGGHSLVAFNRNIVKKITGTFITKATPTYAISVNDMIINEGYTKDICFNRPSNGNLSAAEFELSFTQRERPGKGGFADDFTLSDTTIIFDANETQSCVAFTAIKDTHFDWAHDIYLDISDPSNGQSISRSRMKITILDIYFPNRIDWRRK
ncbi:MAG: Ig-like domain-containing protein, partial [Candidatus Marinimicrobia bacterium]|nr:Ig-like domain-containing protein [Candidatus Neomarinimicrobiota bacterium]